MVLSKYLCFPSYPVTVYRPYICIVCLHKIILINKATKKKNCSGIAVCMFGEKLVKESLSSELN